MSSKIRFTCEQKLKIVNYYLELPLSDRNYKAVAEKFNCSHLSVKLWVEKYNNFGPKGLEAKTTRQDYSPEFKESVVKSILSREFTRAQIVKKYDLNYTILNNWIKKFNINGAKALEAKSSYTEYSLDFMLNAVKYVKEIRNVALACEQLNITAPTLIKWVKLYSEQGCKGLSNLYLKTMKKRKEVKPNKRSNRKTKVTKSKVTTTKVIETNVSKSTVSSNTSNAKINVTKLLEINDPAVADYVAQLEHELKLTKQELRKEKQITKKQSQEVKRKTKEVKRKTKEVAQKTKEVERKTLEAKALKKLSALLNLT